MEPKLVSESQCKQPSGCSMPEAAQSNEKSENLRSKEELRHPNLVRSTGSTSLPLRPTPEYLHMMANEMLQICKISLFSVRIKSKNLHLSTLPLSLKNTWSQAR